MQQLFDCGTRGVEEWCVVEWCVVKCCAVNGVW